MTAIVVLYEDSRAANGRFGPHDLLMALVADQIGSAFLDLGKRVRAMPLNGVGNLLKAIRQPQRLAPAGCPVLAVIDADKIRKHLKMRDADGSAGEKKILDACEEPARLEVVLLERNVESLIDAARDCDKHGSLPSDQIEAALAKDLNARDLVLSKVALDPNRSSIRDCIRKRVPSLEPAIAAIAAAIAA